MLDAIRKSIKNSTLRRKRLREFRRWGEEERRRCDFYRQFIKPGDLVFDVGANLGNRSKIFLHLQARVVAFEPQAVCADFLESALQSEPEFILERMALGHEAGEMEMMVDRSHTISTLSREWMSATRESGRFAGHQWQDRQQVRVITLDEAIRRHGLPAFTKIDVEGYEFEVLSGLTRPLPCISIEFTAETVENSRHCITHMSRLSAVRFQLSLGESMGFALPDWVDSGEMERVLSETIEQDRMAWGDIYIRG